MNGFAKVVTDPVEALVHVGKENTDLHEELAAVYAEVDLYRDALMAIKALGEVASREDRYTRAQAYAKAALSGQRLAEWYGIAVRKTINVQRPS